MLLFLMIIGVDAVPVEQWNKTFGGSYVDNAGYVQQTSDGGYILAGFTESHWLSKGDAWLIKTDANGNQLWSKKFGGMGEDAAHFVQQTSDGGYILAGYTSSFWTSDYDVWLIKTDASGNELWSKTFGGTNDDWTESVQQTTDGGYIVAGRTASYGAGSGDAWLIKIDPNGNQLWSKTYGGRSDDNINRVQQTSDGGYILTGFTASYGAGDLDVWLIKTDANGNELWSKVFGGVAYDGAFSVRQTSDGGYILSGATKSYGAGDADFWLLKTDSSGNESWNKTFGSTGNDWAWSVHQTSDGGYVIAGEMESDSDRNKEAWLIKTDANGNELWNKTFGGIKNDRATHAQQVSDGGYILVGITESYGSGNEDVWLIKVSSDLSSTSKSTITETKVITTALTETAGIPVSIPTEKAKGFDIVIAIATFSAVYTLGRERK